MLSLDIDVHDICKSHGDCATLHNISFHAVAGRVTAFLGPNGAGKSSTLRILLGLDRATQGSATFGQSSYREIEQPLKHVGALFDTLGGAKSRRVRTHLRILAESNAIPSRRVGEVLETVEMTHKAAARLGTLSLGESQRIGLAAALLGDPQFLVLDEPTNGLDPGGIRWFRGFIKQQAASGRTVLLSSHMLNEVEAIADDVVVINKGRIVSQGSLEAVKDSLSTEMKSSLVSLEDLFFSLTEGTQR